MSRHRAEVHVNVSELLQELALRAGVAEPETGRVVLALRDLVKEGRVPRDVLWSESGQSVPTDAVTELIASARRHPFGVDFLLEGYLPSVAAEFHAHAFIVEAARARLRQGVER